MLQNGLTLTLFFFFLAFTINGYGTYSHYFPYCAVWHIRIHRHYQSTCHLAFYSLHALGFPVSILKNSAFWIPFFFLPIRLKLYNMDRGFKQYSHYTNLEKEKLQRQFFSPVCLPFTISVTRLWMPNKTKVPKEGGGFCGGIRSSPWRNPFFFLFFFCFW